LPTKTPPNLSAARVVAIIPARLGSTRFPEKVLADRTGRTLIQHVYDAAKAAGSLDHVVVAVDDPRVRDAVESFGGTAVMTSSTHANGSSRLAEAARLLRLAEDVLVVNVQGDEPELEASVIDTLVREALKARAPVATIASPIENDAEFANPNVVKVVRRVDHTALYFSRASIPFPRTSHGPRALKHIGIYAYRAAFLQRYVMMTPTPLELAESLEQLRVLEHGQEILVVEHPVTTTGIDTPEQYEAFVERWGKGR
jgi:3-deoxy-manno-octulosonate cytidylyltransferase (CMP-KDO synthetase)